MPGVYRQAMIDGMMAAFRMVARLLYASRLPTDRASA